MRQTIPYIYRLIFILLLVSGCHPALQLVDGARSSNPVASSTLEADAEIESIIAPYRLELEKEMDVVLATSAMTMPKLKGQSETVLGNFVADLCLHQARAISDIPIDACLLNFGGLRSDNELVIITLSPSEIDSMFTYLGAANGQPVSEMSLRISEGKALERTIGGGQVDVKKSYRILTSDYLATGGDNMRFLTDGRRSGYVQTGLLVREAIIAHVRELGQKGEALQSQIDGRIQTTEQ